MRLPAVALSCATAASGLHAGARAAAGLMCTKNLRGSSSSKSESLDEKREGSAVRALQSRSQADPKAGPPSSQPSNLTASFSAQII